MFEEVPRERRGVARLLPVQRVVLGPFVLGGGMLVAALGGSVAVAAAATMITASAIGSGNDLPARPGYVVAPSTSSDGSVSARRRQARPLPARPGHAVRPTAPPTAGVPTSQGAAGLGAAGGSAAGGSPGGGAPSLSSVAPPSSTTAAGPGAGRRTPAPSTPAGSPTPSAGGPLGNAVIHVSGYDQARSRLLYQFATVRPHAGIDGGDLYLISGRQGYSAALAPSITITSGGGICPPAGSTCTLDQVIQAADSGFFAQVAIDAQGVLRSIIEVGNESATAKSSPAPSTGAQLDSGRRGAPSSSPPTPTAGPTASS